MDLLQFFSFSVLLYVFEMHRSSGQCPELADLQAAWPGPVAGWSVSHMSDYDSTQFYA